VFNALPFLYSRDTIMLREVIGYRTGDGISERCQAVAGIYRLNQDDTQAQKYYQELFLTPGS